jgi:hypothetical protein
MPLENENFPDKTSSRELQNILPREKMLYSLILIFFKSKNIQIFEDIFKFDVNIGYLIEILKKYDNTQYSKEL